jgi:phytoene dehydrogenase-like protein
MTQYDILIIGAGHNGLTTAGFLTQAGKRVLVLEQRTTPGGIVATEEILPGVRANTGFPSAHLLHPVVIDKLGLSNHGLELIESPVTLFAPQGGGAALVFGDDSTTAKSIAQFSPQDAKKYPEFIAFVRRIAGVLAAMMPLTPPDCLKWWIRASMLVPSSERGGGMNLRLSLRTGPRGSLCRR